MRGFIPLGMVAVTIPFLGCATIHPIATGEPHLEGRVITEEMIAGTSAATAWDVIQQTGFFRMLSEPGSSRFGIHSRRGKTSVLLVYSDVPRLIVDGARVSDLSQLRQISAGSIAWIQLLGGIEGGAEEGTNSGGGVLRVVSKVGR